MAVIQAGGGKDWFSSILPLVGMLVPGAGPYIAGATLLNGLFNKNPQQALTGAAGMAAPAVKQTPSSTVGSVMTPDIRAGNMIGHPATEDPRMKNWMAAYRRR